MKEVGILNRGIAKAISEQGHHDLIMVCDAGFATPKDVEVIDISLIENQPRVIDLLNELKKFFSVEKIILANQAKNTNPSYFSEIIAVFDDPEIEIIDHKELKKLSESVKAIIRTGDFTAYANVILVSGAGKRWYSEKDP
ncbi:MAG: D-ribose pyranase [Salinivirgaceae bacterium]